MSNQKCVALSLKKYYCRLFERTTLTEHYNTLSQEIENLFSFIMENTGVNITCSSQYTHDHIQKLLPSPDQ